MLFAVNCLEYKLVKILLKVLLSRGNYYLLAIIQKAKMTR